jgi:NAD(P)-dependent dehydrogenase (short-subunit alcohol dehydrogenase family)
VLNLQGKVALVMGCGAVAEGWGNGRASATLLARQGAQVYGTDLQLSHAENTRDIVRAEGGTMEVAACDVTQAEQVNRVVDDCVQRFGRIDILVNNVGLSQPGGPVDMLQPRVWTVLAAAVPTPATGTTRATAVLLHVSAFSTLRFPLTEADPPADASPLACADPLAVGAARILRLGAVVGQLAVAGAVNVPSGTLSLAMPARALAGELVRVDVTLAALVRNVETVCPLAVLT